MSVTTNESAALSFDAGILKRVISAVERSLQEQDIAVPLAKKATLFTQVYEEALTAGKVPARRSIDRLVWLS